MLKTEQHRGHTISYDSTENNRSLKVNDINIFFKTWKKGDKLKFNTDELYYISFEGLLDLGKALIDDRISTGKLQEVGQ